MSLEFCPTSKILWSEFFDSQPPDGITYERNPTNGRGPLGHPDRCVRISDGNAFAFAHRTGGATVGEVDDGTRFELFGIELDRGRGGRLLAAVAKHLGVRLIKQYEGDLLGEDGDIYSGVYNDELIKKSDDAIRLTRGAP